jgi:Leucine-rich repeat (LRR) protein
MLGTLPVMKISSLSLAQNEITAIEFGTFKKLNNLKYLSLNSNKLLTLHEKSFEGLRNLEILDLSHNVLTSLSSETFTALNSLKKLSLAHNMIERLEGKIFAIPTLQTLDVSFNYITYIQLDVKNLTALNLSNNDLSAIDNNIFMSLASLETLDLSFNKIVEVELNAFSSMKSLKWLSLSRNNLTEVPQYAELPSDLRVLHLGGNGLQDLGDAVNALSLQELHVESNYLQKLDVNASRLMVRCCLLIFQAM